MPNNEHKYESVNFPWKIQTQGKPNSSDKT